MEKANAELRRELMLKGIPFWRLGEALGLSEWTVCRWFRKPLSEERLSRVRSAIAAISGEA